MIKAGERSCWPRIKFISNRMKVENVILTGLRSTGAASSVRASTVSRTLEQQDKEAEYVHKDSDLEGSVVSDDEFQPPAYHASPGRRQSSIIEELSRQASVLWDEPDHEEGATTTDDDEEMDRKTR
jgi:hypothetical protein